jgi:hypothetical protein
VNNLQDDNGVTFPGKEEQVSVLDTIRGFSLLYNIGDWAYASQTLYEQQLAIDLTRMGLTAQHKQIVLNNL